MNPRATIVAWEQERLAAGPDPFGKLTARVQRAFALGDHEVLGELAAKIARLVLVDSSGARGGLQPLADALTSALDADGRLSGREIGRSESRLAIIDLFNAVVCTGASVEISVETHLRPWLVALASAELSDLLRIRLAFAALALDDLGLALEVARTVGCGDAAFDPRHRCRGDMIGLLGHFIGARQCNADRFAVLPAWRSAVEQITELGADGLLDAPTLLWLARLVYHDHCKQPMDKVAEAAHEILWRIPEELEGEDRARRTTMERAASATFPIGGTLDDGCYVIDERLLGEGSQQLCCGHHVRTGMTVLVSHDIHGSRGSVDELREVIAYRAPGVFDLDFVGILDKGHDASSGSATRWAVVERVTRGAWLPRALPQAHDAQAAARAAVDLALTAGRILARAAEAGVLLVRARPEYMWAEHAGQWEVTGLSARGDELFRRKSTELPTPPLFDRYYHAPEWHREPDDRALVFSLSVMCAEWATGRYPFEHLIPHMGLDLADHLPIEGPPMLRELLEEGLQLDRRDRPHLGAFLEQLAVLSKHAWLSV
jgi:hypothetical protein